MARLLNISRVQVIGHLICLWDTVAIFQAGDAASLSAEYVAEVSLWDGDPNALFDAMVRTGWITPEGNVLFQGCAHIVHGAVTRTGKHSWRVLRLKILARDEYTCRYCGSSDPLVMQVDHVHPITLGGTDDESNLVAACRSCNAKKNNKPLEVFLNGLSES